MKLHRSGAKRRIDEFLIGRIPPRISDLDLERPRIRILVEYRARLSVLLEARHNAAESLHDLQAWCREAEASGIRALQEFSARLKGYSLQSVRA